MTRPTSVPRSQADQIVRYWRGYMTESEIARHLGVHAATVKAVLRQNARTELEP